MIEAEISRRCPDCGASIRERSFFCPQCGRELERLVAEKPTLGNQTFIERADSLTENAHETLPGKADEKTAEDQPEPARKSPAGRDISHPGRERQRVRPLVVQNGHASAENRGHRATAAAREVIEGSLLQRVENLRKASSVVIDQAAYDPSVRFVLVAALLFAIFLVILLVNELI